MSNSKKDIIPGDQKNLYVDIGNSVIKISYLEQGKWIKPEKFEHDEVFDLLSWISESRHKFGRLIISSVVKQVSQSLIGGMGNRKFEEIKITDVPVRHLNYETVDTLGIDRYLACLGASEDQGESTIVIDAGTACTIDYMDADDIYQGGVIMPGLFILEKGLKNYAPALPAVNRTIPDQWPGKSTEKCLQWGITGMFRDSIIAVLKRYEKAFGSFDLVLTGGDAEMLESLLPYTVRIDPYLVFKGMRQFMMKFFQ